MGLARTPFGFELSSHELCPVVHQVPVPARSNMNTSSVTVNHVCSSNAIARIGETQSRKANSRSGARVAGAAVGRRVTEGKVILLLVGHLCNQRRSPAESVRPVAQASGASYPVMSV